MRIIEQGKIPERKTLYNHECHNCGTKFEFDLKELPPIRADNYLEHYIRVKCPFCQADCIVFR